MNRVTSFLALTAAFALTWAAPSAAAEFPTKPIRLIVGAPPGGPSDAISRALADGLGKRLGQPVIVENKPGANWLVATSLLATSPADGHTLLFLYSTPLSVLPFMYRKPLPYNAETDFAGVALLGELNGGLIVRSDLPYKTAKEYVDAAKLKPDELTYGSAGLGQLYTLAMALFSRQVGVQLREVPYPGAAQISQALLAGSIDSTYMEVGSTRPFIESGKFRLLAVAGTERLKAFPNVPTFREAGFPSHQIPSVWFGIIAPAKIPADAKERLNRAVNEELQTESMKKLYTSLSVTPLSGTPERLDTMIRQDIQVWGGIAKDLGVKLD